MEPPVTVQLMSRGPTVSRMRRSTLGLFPAPVGKAGDGALVPQSMVGRDERSPGDHHRANRQVNRRTQLPRCRFNDARPLNAVPTAKWRRRSFRAARKRRRGLRCREHKRDSAKHAPERPPDRESARTTSASRPGPVADQGMTARPSTHGAGSMPAPRDNTRPQTMLRASSGAAPRTAPCAAKSATSCQSPTVVRHRR